MNIIMLNFDHMKNTIASLMVVLALICPSFAAENKTITLQDGSQVKGHVVSLENGVYVVQTPSMGEVRISDSKIAAITSGAAVTPEQLQQAQQPAQAETPSNLTATPEFQAIQAKVMSNPDVISDIQKLLQDPAVMSVMSDPGFIAAVQSGNTASLQSDPRLKRLSENPQIQALIQKIQSQ